MLLNLLNYLSQYDVFDWFSEELRLPMALLVILVVLSRLKPSVCSDDRRWPAYDHRSPPARGRGTSHVLGRRRHAGETSRFPQTLPLVRFADKSLRDFPASTVMGRGRVHDAAANTRDRVRHVRGVRAFVAVLPAFISDFKAQQYAYVGIYLIALLGLNILTGYTEQISLGHGAFMAIGGYTSALLIAGNEQFGGSLGGGMKDIWTIPLAGLVWERRARIRPSGPAALRPLPRAGDLRGRRVCPRR